MYLINYESGFNSGLSQWAIHLGEKNPINLIASILNIEGIFIPNFGLQDDDGNKIGIVKYQDIIENYKKIILEHKEDWKKDMYIPVNKIYSIEYIE